MGIRYYACPITAEAYVRAREKPCCPHGCDPLADAVGMSGDQSDILDLDKCWRDLRFILKPAAGQAARPASKLVEGRVTDTDTGWVPFKQALGPDQVSAIAVDLATVGEADIRRAVSARTHPDVSDDDEYHYIAQYLADATRFTARLASEGHGLVYVIG